MNYSIYEYIAFIFISAFLAGLHQWYKNKKKKAKTVQYTDLEARIKMDLIIYGNAFIQCNADGTKERIDPTEVRIYKKK